MVVVAFDDDFQNPLLIDNIPGYGVVRLNVYPTGFAQAQETLKRLIDGYPVETREFASIAIDSRKIRFGKRKRFRNND